MPDPTPKTNLFQSVVHVARTIFKIWKVGFFLIIFLTVLDSLAPILISRLQGQLIDVLLKATQSKVTADLGFFLLLLFSVMFFQRLIYRALDYVSKVSREHLGKHFRLELVQQYLRMEPADFSQPYLHNLLHRVNESIPHRLLRFYDELNVLIGDLISFLFLVGVFVTLSPVIVVLIILSSLPDVLLNRYVQRRSWREYREDTDKRRHLGRLQHYLTREEVVEAKIFGFTRFLLDSLTENINYLISRYLRLEKLNLMLLSGVQFVTAFLYGVCVLIIVDKYLKSQLTLGQASFYFSLIPQLLGKVREFSRAYNSLSEMNLYISDYRELLQYEPLLEDGKQKLNLASSVNIEFKNVWFSYPGQKKYVLKDVSFSLKSGESLALVGHNGAGKSTIIKLLCRFYDVTKGEIQVNGVPIQAIQKESLRKMISLLSQDFMRYYFDVKTNIVIGDIKQKGNLARLHRVARLAGVDQVVKGFPKGFKQILDKSFEGGVEPSTGQWQRIALARSLFKESPVIVLDEPTSAIDPAAEYSIFKKLFHWFSGNHALLIVSHRFSTVRTARRILVLSGGRIVEEGTHQELLTSKGMYFSAYQMQKEGYLD